MSAQPAAAPESAAPGGALRRPGARGAARVLVVDDSRVVCRMIGRVLAGDPGIEVVGHTCDPTEVVARVREQRPDVLTLDVEMPGMNGLDVLRAVMRECPLPVVMVSAHTRDHAAVTLAALEHGAVDFVCKPDARASSREAFARDLLAKVRAAARSRPRAGMPAARRAPSPAAFTATTVIPPATAPRVRPAAAASLVAIGASTGGTEAIRRVLERLPTDAPGIVVVQHIPPAFAASFAARLDAVTALDVRLAAPGMEVRPGRVCVAPGDRHLLVRPDGSGYACRLADAPPVNRHRPSVDVLFRSVAQVAGAAAIGVILTGMGDDGARGLLEMRDAGAPTVAQDEASSVVWGMPGEAVRRGAAADVLALDRIAGHLISLTLAPA